MQMKWGNLFTWAADSLTIATSIDDRLDESGRPYAAVKTADIKGTLLVNGPLDASQQMAAMIAALQVPYQDLVYSDSSSNVMSASVLNVTSMTGVRCVKGPTFPVNINSEGVTLRSFAFTVQAEYPITTSNARLLSFRETVEFSGGAPQFVYKPSLNKPPQKQQTWFSTPYNAVQHGEAVGYLAYPTASNPLWPAFLMENPRIVRVSPDRKGPTKYEKFRTTWSYRFQSQAPLPGGFPNVWKG